MRAQTIELLPSGTLTGSGETTGFPVKTGTMAVVGVDVGTEGGTTPELTVWLQVSDDGGTTWYDMPYDQAMVTSTGDTDVTADTDKRNIVDEITSGDAQHIATYKHLPADTVRLKWVISGTSPTWPVSASMVVK